ncbi:MAG: type II toxin-antitoxin system HicB family antitoxin [Kiritimatiellaeota bacterium]|nr:type II toxin-antitoxin system HicB family antitoxin [Kiritimatiellota bacterium]
MMNRYTAIIEKDGGWWVGWIAEVQGVNCQERTQKKLMESLQETLSEAIEMNRNEALAAASEGYTQEAVRV